MPYCASCGTEIPESGRYCPACGAETVVPSEAAPSRAEAPTVASSSWTPVDSAGGEHARFVPGAIVNGRYRIVGLLGRGGMGEVYRADDLKLGQPVALKFLPVGLERDAARLRQFLHEVRTARQITHPNVCRVYDVDEVEGEHFLSMEYIDGEDLASLLRRIGRLPHERAVEVGRQICNALAATHAEGILHRDLKPANVMIDGRGRVRLTDFGLAGLSDLEGGGPRGAGTPAYMAPEVITGGEATVASDVYALGLVLYELFTGKPAFEAGSVAEYRRLHESTAPSSPSSHIPDLDPAVEAVVLRCLEKTPASRPPSAQAVSAALPGGDPLAAALAAGQTPSPELVAEAGERRAMRWPRALLLAAVGLTLAVGSARWAATMTILHWLPLDKPPEVMIDRARMVLADLGFDEPAYRDPVDWSWGLLVWNAIVNDVGDERSPDRWEALRRRPDAAAFWYRQSPEKQTPSPEQEGPLFVRGPVSLMNPPPLTPGEAVVMFDLQGRMSRLEVLPKRLSTVEVAEPDWGPLFELAGLDRSRFTETRPRYQRFLAPDHRRAWTGTREDSPDVPLFVEAGSFEGRATLFNAVPLANIEPLGADPEPEHPTVGGVAMRWLAPLVILALVVVAFVFARRNLRQGRADRRGALRFAVAFAGLLFVSRAFRSHLIFTFLWPGEVWPLIGASLFSGMIGWLLYSASEPIGRRVWPTMFVSSSRLLSRPRIVWRDPLIGTSVLVGLVAGGCAFLIEGPLRWTLGGLLSGQPPTLFGYPADALVGQRAALASLLNVGWALAGSLLNVVALVLMRLTLKRPWLAIVAAVLIWVAIKDYGSVEGWVYGLVVASIEMAVLLRYGVVALVTTSLVTQWAWLARSADWSAWHSQPAKMAAAALAALAVYGVWAATGGAARESDAPEPSPT